MDHSNSAGQKCSHCQCRHGQCFDHEPELEDVGEKWHEPCQVGTFGWLRAWLLRVVYGTMWDKRCCGRWMVRNKEVQARRCKKCGRTEDHVTVPEFLLCSCCGYRCTFYAP